MVLEELNFITPRDHKFSPVFKEIKTTDESRKKTICFEDNKIVGSLSITDTLTTYFSSVYN